MGLVMVAYGVGKGYWLVKVVGLRVGFLAGNDSQRLVGVW
jgi:hypothetical protein